jgi:hypothetical protein
MRNILFLFLALSMVALSTSCEDITEVNNDPTRLNDASLSLMLPIVQAGHYRNEGTNPCRVAGIAMQQLLGFDAQQLGYNTNVIGEDAMNNYWTTGLYAGTMKDAIVMIDKAEEEGNAFYEGLGKIFLAAALADATSYFGDIPYSEAFQGTAELKPVYDSQESIYNEVQSLLDQAVAALQTGEGYIGGDLVFGGDTGLWVKTANALKARYLLHTQKRKDVTGEVLALIDASMVDVSEEATFQFGTAETENWTLAKFGRERTNTLVFNTDFAEALESSNDPRLTKYAVLDGTTWQYWVLGDANLVWAIDNAAVPLVSYAELMFMKAEALLRDGAADADVNAALRAGITASMTLVELDPAEADVAAYIDANSEVSGSFDEKLEQIMNEAYIAYFGHNFSQSWANYRRTGYPALTPVPGGDGGGLNPGGGIIQRYLYPTSETQTNRENADAARARQGGGLLNAPVWAFE